MFVLRERLDKVLGEGIYKRQNPNLVQNALIRLGVEASEDFKEFYKQYAGPFWEENIPFELLDLVDGENNIESYTLIVRKEYGFPKQFLVLSEMSANAVLMLDSEMDCVYTINFEGGDELLLKRELNATWPSFFDFLTAYFNC